MIVCMADSEWRSRQNNLCNHMHKSKLREFLSSENSVAKITAGYLKQENLPFPRLTESTNFTGKLGFCPVLVAQ